MLRNLKRHGASLADMKDVYEKQVRSVLKLAVPVWQPDLTKCQSNQIERVQRTACAILLGINFVSYKKALKTLNLKT